jgi:hypothetical protein
MLSPKSAIPGTAAFAAQTLFVEHGVDALTAQNVRALYANIARQPISHLFSRKEGRLGEISRQQACVAVSDILWHLNSDTPRGQFLLRLRERYLLPMRATPKPGTPQHSPSFYAIHGRDPTPAELPS